MYFVISSPPEEVSSINVTVSFKILLLRGSFICMAVPVRLLGEWEVKWEGSSVLVWVLHFTKGRETGKSSGKS